MYHFLWGTGTSFIVRANRAKPWDINLDVEHIARGRDVDLQVLESLYISINQVPNFTTSLTLVSLDAIERFCCLILGTALPNFTTVSMEIIVI